MEFSEIYTTYWQKIYRICRGYVNNDDWAKDIAQDTFINVFNNLENFKGNSKISTWIFRIAVNNCLRQIENQNRMPKSAIIDNLIQPDEIKIDNKIELLYQAINELKETDRIIISLELEELKQAEIAEIVGISETNVRVKIHRIKEKLTEKFKNYERD